MRDDARRARALRWRDVFASDLECVRACQCNASKFHAGIPYDSETRCDWVGLKGWLDGGLSDAGYDGGTECRRLINDCFHCYAWFHPSSDVTGTPLGENGVRTLCALSRRREVVSLLCVIQGE